MIEICASNDGTLILIKGDIEDEIDYPIQSEPKFIGVSDGTLLKVSHSKGNRSVIVRVECLKSGISNFTKRFEAVDTPGLCSDIVRLDGQITWVMLCEQFSGTLSG